MKLQVVNMKDEAELIHLDVSQKIGQVGYHGREIVLCKNSTNDATVNVGSKDIVGRAIIQDDGSFDIELPENDGTGSRILDYILLILTPSIIRE